MMVSSVCSQAVNNEYRMHIINAQFCWCCTLGLDVSPNSTEDLVFTGEEKEINVSIDINNLGLEDTETFTVNLDVIDYNVYNVEVDPSQAQVTIIRNGCKLTETVNYVSILAMRTISFMLLNIVLFFVQTFIGVGIRKYKNNPNA